MKISPFSRHASSPPLHLSLRGLASVRLKMDKFQQQIDTLSSPNMDCYKHELGQQTCRMLRRLDTRQRPSSRAEWHRHRRDTPSADARFCHYKITEICLQHRRNARNSRWNKKRSSRCIYHERRTRNGLTGGTNRVENFTVSHTLWHWERNGSIVRERWTITWDNLVESALVTRPTNSSETRFASLQGKFE